MSVLKGWRTILFNVVGGLLFLLGWGPLAQWVDPQYIAIAVTVGNLILRYLTDTPVGSPTPPAVP